MKLPSSFLVYSLLTLFTCCTLAVQSQNTNYTIPDSMQRSLPFFGFNGNTLRGPSWINTEFNDSVATMAPKLLRYPAGKIANYWDWETGWFYNQNHLDTVLVDTVFTMNDSWYTYDSLDMSPTVFKDALNQIDAEGVFVMNMMSSSLEKQISDLEFALSEGLTIKWIELGSEFNHNDDFVTFKYPTAGDYAREAAIWAEEIKLLLPEVKIAVVAGNRGTEDDRAYRWNDSILTYCPNVDAFVWHVYLYLNETNSLYTDKQLLAYPYFQIPLYESWRGFENNNPYLENYQLWVTEYNMFDKTSDKMFSNNWAHVLVLAGINDKLLQNNKTTMLLQHNVGGYTEFDALNCSSDASYAKRAPGISSYIWNQLSKDMNYCTEIRFDSALIDTVNYIKSNGTTVNIEFPNAFGWIFENDTSKAMLITNISPDTIYISIDSVFTGDVLWKKWTANALRDRFDENGLLIITSDSSKVDVCIPPYSICTVTSYPNHDNTSTEQTLNLLFGWNMISTYIMPTESNIDSLVKAIEGNIIILKDQNGLSYLPAWNYNGIGDWNSLEGYQIKLSQNCEFTFEGEILQENTIINLHEGWSIIPFLKQESLSSQVCLDSIIDEIIILKDNLGNVILPSFGLWNIDTLMPGQGYLIKTSQELNFTYPQ